MSNMRKRFPWARKKNLLPLSGALVVLTAVTAVAFSYGPMFSVDPESASLSGGTTAVADSNASGGQSIRFGSGSGIPQIADFPTRESVGPAVDPTVAYSGDCYFSNEESPKLVENVIIDCEANSGLRFAENASGWVFRNTIIRGMMFTINQTLGDPGAETYPREPIFTVEDSEIIQRVVEGDPGQDRALCCSHYVVRNSLIQGSHSVLAVHNNAIIEDNYMTTDGTSTHQSAGRMLRNVVLRGNTISCTPHGNADPGNPAYQPYDDSGCSAHAVFYREALGGENVPAFNLTIENNYFKRGVTAGGQSGGPYYATRFIDCADWTDCTGITVTGNLFSLDEGTDAGEFPFYGGNVWANNYWTDGQPAESNQSR
jgi:hypothetical protein